MTTSQKSLFYTACGVLAVWVIINAMFLIVKRQISAPLFTPVSSIKRLLWLSAVLIVLAMHCTKKVNGNGLIVHYHHALVGWGVFSLAVLFGTIKGIVGLLNQILATIALTIIIHGAVAYDVDDFQLFTDAQGTEPSKSARNMYVVFFVALIIILSIRLPTASSVVSLPRLETAGKKQDSVAEKNTLLHTEIRF